MLTKSQIDRAGVRLRKAEAPSDADRELYNEFRADFAESLAEVIEDLRGLAGDAPVTSRLKRFETTIQKLRRHRSRLSSIEDIAGCRVVLPTMREQHTLRDRMRQSFEVVRERDYQSEMGGGYRALHIVVRKGGRLVEVQLRTNVEDNWANAVERIADRFDTEIKYGGGPRELRDVLEIEARIAGQFDIALVAFRQLAAALGTIVSDEAKYNSLIEAMQVSHSSDASSFVSATSAAYEDISRVVRTADHFGGLAEALDVIPEIDGVNKKDLLQEIMKRADILPKLEMLLNMVTDLAYRLQGLATALEGIARLEQYSDLTGTSEYQHLMFTIAKLDDRRGEER